MTAENKGTRFIKITDQTRFRTDAKGRLVPLELIDELDLARDEIVVELAEAAKVLRAAMLEFKMRAVGDVQAFVELSAERYGVKMGGQKGNITLTSYDGRYKIQVAIAEYIVFDERLQAAKILIDECLTEWSEQSRAEIRTIVMDAFQVDQEGRVSIGRILRLRHLQISDPRWLRAMQAIADSMQVAGSKSYMRFYDRETADGKYLPITLDLAAL
jgi:hypothetical protein